jgi:hypothetical protein
MDDRGVTSWPGARNAVCYSHLSAPVRCARVSGSLKRRPSPVVAALAL